MGPYPRKGLGVYAAQVLIWAVPRYQTIEGHDPVSGEIKKSWEIRKENGHFSYQCAPGIAATVNYLVGGRPIVYLEIKTGEISFRRVARNACGGEPGLLFGNGLIYAFPKTCGCFPMLLQFPVFIALFTALRSAIELRHAPFILWIQDLSAKDPYYVLPILMGLVMFAQQKMTPSADPQQARMALILPIVFTFFFMNFPSGLVLYWLVNSLLSLGEQWWIRKRT